MTQKERDALPSPEHTHRWTVAVRSAASVPGSDQVGGADDLSYFIKRVTFKLHDTYPTPTRSKPFRLMIVTSTDSNPDIDKPPFEVTETGWGEFEIIIRITFIPEAGEKTMTLLHHLKLHPWTVTGEPEIPPLDVALKAGPVHSWQYDEIVFNDPFQNFLNLLTAHPPTSLPKSKRRPVPFHLANPGSFEDSKGGTPEFHVGMISEEAERLEEARKKVITEQEKMRNELIEKEQELERLKKALAE